MKPKLTLFATFIMLWVSSFSQELELKNAVKINLSSLAIKNFSFQYERGLTNKISIALGVRFEPKGAIPLKSSVQSIFENADFDLDNFQIGNTAITPEVRFYLGRGKHHGFYIAPYARYANFNLSLPVTYQAGSGSEDALFDGHVSSFSGGVLFGMQYHIGKIVVLDVWLLGAHYGSSNGTATFTPSQPLSNQEQNALQQKLDDINIKPFDFSGTVSSTGAVVQTKGPWVGVRGLGINVGLRF